VEVYWYDGGKKPGMPAKAFNRDSDDMFKGMIFKGDKGYLIADYGFRILMPMGDMTYYKSPKKEDLIPPSKGHHKEWIDACKTDKKTLCNFDYAGALVENNLLALVSYRLGKVETREADKEKGKGKEKEEYTVGRRLEYDPQTGKAKNCPEADAFIAKRYREGWLLNG
jgi:hypothetical protein